MLLLKYQKTGKSSSIEWGRCPYLISLGKSWICQVLPSIVSRATSPIGNKVLDREFHWSAARKFYS